MWQYAGFLFGARACLKCIKLLELLSCSFHIADAIKPFKGKNAIIVVDALSAYMCVYCMYLLEVIIAVCAVAFFSYFLIFFP